MECYQQNIYLFVSVDIYIFHPSVYILSCQEEDRAVAILTLYMISDNLKPLHNSYHKFSSSNDAAVTT